MRVTAGIAFVAYALAAYPLIIAAAPSPIVALGTCTKPNVEASVERPQEPAYPQLLRALKLGYASSVIEVTIDSTGRVADAHIYKSSGNDLVDRATLQAAMQSTYTPKRENCVNVTGAYLFRADYEPEGYAPSDAEIPQSPSAEWHNPFCNVSAVALPWDSAHNAPSAGPAKSYAVYLWTRAKTSFAARVVFVGQQYAYVADIPVTAIPPGAGINRAYAYLVSLPDVALIDHYFVDGDGIDGAAVNDCPSFVKSEDGAYWDEAMQTKSFVALDARVLQPLPPLSCPQRYTAVGVKKDFTPVVGEYGTQPKSAVVEVFVDSAGHSVDTMVLESSGVPGIDAAARSTLEYTTYEPARFLCTPAVSNAIFKIDYESY